MYHHGGRLCASCRCTITIYWTNRRWRPSASALNPGGIELMSMGMQRGSSIWSTKHVSNMCQTCCINSARCLKLLRFAISQHKAFTLVRSPLTRRKRGFSLLTCCTARPRGHKCLQTESSADTTPITTWNFEFCIVLNMWTYVKYEHIWNKGIVKAVLSRQLSIAFSCKCMQMHQCLLAKSRKLVQMIL